MQKEGRILFEARRIRRLVKEGLDAVPGSIWALRSDQTHEMARMMVEHSHRFGVLERESPQRKAISCLLFGAYFFRERQRSDLFAGLLSAAKRLAARHDEVVFCGVIGTMLEQNLLVGATFASTS